MATPEFILRLREKIGHDLLWLIGVTAYVEDSEGRVLLGRRADTGEWALVYGINEPGEEPADTVIREVAEETGVDVVPVALASVKAGCRMTVYANGDQTQYLDLNFVCRLAGGGTWANTWCATAWKWENTLALQCCSSTLWYGPTPGQGIFTKSWALCSLERSQEAFA